MKIDVKKENIWYICWTKLSFKSSCPFITNCHFLQSLKNIYKELFLCKSINQTAAFWYIFFVFLVQFSFVGQTVWLLSLLVPGHLHRCSKQILFFSLAHLLMLKVFLWKLWSQQSAKIKINQWIYIKWWWRSFFSADETTFKFCFKKILYQVGSMRWRSILSKYPTIMLNNFFYS